MRSAAEIIQEAERFADEELRPYASSFEEQGAIPTEVLRRLAERGFLGATLPSAYGGLQLTPVEYGQLLECMGKACNSIRELMTVHTSLVGEALLRFGTEAQKEQWLPKLAAGHVLASFALTEPNVGSDARAVETSYRQEDGGYILNGTKKWITFGGIADVYLVLASHHGTTTAFLVERSLKGVSVRPMGGLLAGKASHMAELQLENVRVSAGNVLGPVGGGFDYIGSTALDHGRYAIAWGSVAIAQEALETMISYARHRKQGGKSICEYDAIQAIIAEGISQIHAARSLCIQAGTMRTAHHAHALSETMIAKYFASKVAMKVATDAIQVLGANGLSNQFPAERLFREAKVMEIIEGTTQVLQPMIAMHGLRAYYKPAVSVPSESFA